MQGACKHMIYLAIASLNPKQECKPLFSDALKENRKYVSEMDCMYGLQVHVHINAMMILN